MRFAWILGLGLVGCNSLCESAALDCGSDEYCSESGCAPVLGASLRLEFLSADVTESGDDAAQLVAMAYYGDEQGQPLGDIECRVDTSAPSRSVDFPSNACAWEMQDEGIFYVSVGSQDGADSFVYILSSYEGQQALVSFARHNEDSPVTVSQEGRSLTFSLEQGPVAP